MSKRSEAIKHCAYALMRAWHPSKTEDWYESEEGKDWMEIAMLDAEVVIDAYDRYEGRS